MYFTVSLAFLAVMHVTCDMTRIHCSITTRLCTETLRVTMSLSTCSVVCSKFLTLELPSDSQESILLPSLLLVHHLVKDFDELFFVVKCPVSLLFIVS